MADVAAALAAPVRGRLPGLDGAPPAPERGAGRGHHRPAAGAAAGSSGAPPAGPSGSPRPGRDGLAATFGWAGGLSPRGRRCRIAGHAFGRSSPPRTHAAGGCGAPGTGMAGCRHANCDRQRRWRSRSRTSWTSHAARPAPNSQPSVAGTMEPSRPVVAAAIAGDAPVYGVNTGFGALADTRVAERDLAGCRARSSAHARGRTVTPGRRRPCARCFCCGPERWRRGTRASGRTCRPG